MNSERRSLRVFEVFETAIGDRGDRSGIFAGAVDDAGSSQLRRHFHSEFLKDIEVGVGPLRRSYDDDD
ncbi:MAG: hypothetical protein CFE32_18575 [Alphaproteobacteria bacterium PA3]|nr:MAG: hypothetical protein CFE32_18575 [Alphaproteobacteria bacterium PA3]